MEPKVSICCITYNHEKYIRDAIEGFLLQKTTFPIEVIIHDDASTDGTANIVKEYADKYPRLIVPILQSENQWSKGVRPSPTYVWPRARGKYIALCEGDDYWTDPLKLQKQMDFLEEHQDCSLCFHAVKFVYANNPEKNYIRRPKRIPKDFKFEMKHIILQNSFIHTSSIMFLGEHIKELPKWLKNAPIGDLPLILLLASKGRMGFINQVMSIYRIGTPNSWSLRICQDRQKQINHHFASLTMFDSFDEWTQKKYHYLIMRKKINNKWIYFKGTIKDILKQSLVFF